MFLTREFIMANNSLLRSAGYCLSTAVMLAVAAASASAWAGPADPVNPLTKRFLQGKPLDICDQGSFYVGGVPKDTIYANSAIAAGPPAESLSARCMCSSKFPQAPSMAAHLRSRVRLFRDRAWEATPDGRRAGYPMRYKTIIPCSW